MDFKMNFKMKMKMNSENEFQNENENELQNEPTEEELREYHEQFVRDNCLEVMLVDLIEKYQLIPIEESWEIHPAPQIPNGLKTIIEYKSEYNIFRVEKTWATNKNANKVIVDLRITKIQGE